jgi:hypothetical protein
MLGALGIVRDRIEFGEPSALFFVPLAGACLIAGVIVFLVMRRLRSARTRGSSYPLIGPIKLWLFAACVLSLAALAAAQPRLRYGGSSFKRGTVDLAVVVDMSASMWVRDVGSSRIELAVRELLPLQTDAILQTGDRVALFVLGGTTIRKVHLSPNTQRAMEEISRLRAPEVLAGDSFPWESAVTDALEHVYRSIDRQDRFESGRSERDWSPVRRSDRAVLFLTDGDFEVDREEMQRVDTALAEFRRRGIQIYPIGIGTRAGSDLTSVLRDYDADEYDPSIRAELEGQRTSLRVSTLSYLADRTGGKVFLIENSGQSATAFLHEAVASHRGLTLQLIPTDDNLDAWQYAVAAAIVLFALAVLFY